MIPIPHGSREAPPQHWALLALKSAAQTATLWALFLWIIPMQIKAFEARNTDWLLPEANTTVCWILFWAMGCSGFYCASLFIRAGKGTPFPLASTRQLVILGPYRYVRNPMALFGIGQGIMIGLILRSPTVVLYSLAGAVLWHLIARPWEEDDLAERFGAEYEAYRSQVRTWIPRLKPYS